MQDTPRKAKNGSSIPQKPENPPAQAGLGLLTRRWIPITAVIGILAAGAAYAYWRNAVLYPSTEDAYVRANVVQIAPLVTGVVSDVKVASYAHVKSGDVLFSVDSAPFDAALKKAQARLTATQQQAQGAPGQPNAKAAVEQAEAAVEEARVELDHATVKAPLEGTVGKVQIAKGSIVKAGMVALPLVDTSSYWVDANFKETDLERIKPGQPATVTVDLAPSETLRGKVDAISPASVSAFSLLPPENATGSWVKVTQRFPVSISIPSAADHPELRIGASATVTVDTSGLASASK